MPRYRVSYYGDTDVTWHTQDGKFPYPTLEEITEAANNEFHGTPFDQLEVSCYGPGEIIVLRIQRPRSS